MERVIEEMNDRKLGVLQGETIRTIKFTDYIAMLKDNQEKLEKSLNVLDRKMKSKFKMRMNQSKTKGSPEI